MGSGSKAKASARPRGAARTLNAPPSGGAGQGAGGVSESSKETLIPLVRIDPAVLRRAAARDAVALKDDGTTIPVLWKGRTLGLVPKSHVVRVRESKTNVGRIARIESKPPAVWVALG